MALLSRERYSEVDIIVCDATPEGDIAAPVGSMALSTEGVLYTKASGAGNTGWAAPPKTYYANLTQTGTGAPVATVLINTLGGDPVFSYDGTGNYIMDLTGLVTAGNFTVQYSGSIEVENPSLIAMNIASPVVFIFTYRNTPPVAFDNWGPISITIIAL